MQSSHCQSWCFVWVFGYENEELIMSEFVHCQGFWILRCRAHPAKVGTLSVFLYDDVESILPKLLLCHGFWI